MYSAIGRPDTKAAVIVGAECKANPKTYEKYTPRFPDDVIEMALAHAVDGKVEAAYRRGDLFEKRRQLMDAWARFCGSVPADNITPFPSRGAR